MSYQDFLLNVAKVDPQVLWFFRHFGEGVFCVGADATPALFAWQMGQPGFSGLQLDPTPEGVLSELPGRAARPAKGRRRRGGTFPGRQRHRRAVAGPLADSRRSAGQDDGGRRRGARQLCAARPPESARAHSPEQHGAQRETRWRSRPGERSGGQLQPRRQNVRRARQGVRDGLLEHVHPLPGARSAGGAEGSAGLRGERPAGLHQRWREELDGLAEAGGQLH